MSEAEKAEAEKAEAKKKRRAEIEAKLAEDRKKLEEQEKQDKIKSALSFLNAPPSISRTRKELVDELSQRPPNITENKIEELKQKFHLDASGVYILVNMTRKSEDKENAVNLENILVNKMIPGDIENKKEKLLESVEIKEGTETIDIYKTTRKFIMRTWLSSLWKYDNTIINTYKIESFEKNVSIFESMLTDLQNYKKNPIDENDSNVQNIIDEQFNESRDDMFNNCISHNWGIFSLLFILDKGNKYKEFFNNINFYQKNTKLKHKSIEPLKSMITNFETRSYNSFSEKMINIFDTIEQVIDMIDHYFSNPNSNKPNINSLNDIYSTFVDNSILFSIFLIFDSYKGAKGKNIMRSLEKLSDKFKTWITKWDKALSEKDKENTVYQEYMLFNLNFSYSIIKMIKYSLIPVELRTRLGMARLLPGEPPSEPPGGGFTLTTGKNKKKGGRRRTQKKHYKK